MKDRQILVLTLGAVTETANESERLRVVAVRPDELISEHRRTTTFGLLQAYALDRPLVVVAIDLDDEKLLQSVDGVLTAIRMAESPACVIIRGELAASIAELDTAGVWRRLERLRAQWKTPVVQVPEGASITSAVRMLADNGIARRFQGDLSNLEAVALPDQDEWRFLPNPRERQEFVPPAADVSSVRNHLRKIWRAIGVHAGVPLDPFAEGLECAHLGAGEMAIFNTHSAHASRMLGVRATAQLLGETDAPDILWLAGPSSAEEVVRSLWAAAADVAEWKVAQRRLDRTDVAELSWAASALSRTSLDIAELTEPATCDPAATVRDWARRLPVSSRAKLLVVEDLNQAAHFYGLDIETLVVRLIETAGWAGYALVATSTCDLQALESLRAYARIIKTRPAHEVASN